MAPERSRIGVLAQAVADGTQVDWDAELSAARDTDEHLAIEQLRAVADIARRHTSALPSEVDATRTMHDAVTTLSSGQVLGDRYRIQSFLGRGGMGQVWHAFDLKLRVDVALKMLLPDQYSNELMLERLRSEVRSAREVVSPNVCRIFDLIEIGGHELVSMEYIDGTTLLDVLQVRGPLELREAGEIAAQFLSGIEAIHQVGLIHRDVKPENIMITRSGRVVLMDFGLAKPDTDLKGSIAGTPAYMSPEQMTGESLDARADIFASGVVLAEMIDSTGRKETREPIHRGAHEDPPRLPDGPWQSVLVRAVARDRTARFGSAQALNRALEEVTLRVEGAEQLKPYPGLASFTANDAEYFFGREAEIETLWKKLRRPHLLGLIGPSGAGKSSFLRAGLLPAMPQTWSSVVCHPGDGPMLSVGRALAPEFAGDTEAIRDMIRFEDPEVALGMFRRWRQRHDEVLLVVDQFEELFTLNPPETQSRFAELLGRLALDADVHVLLSMRDDFLFHCHEHSTLTPMLSELTLLGPPVGAALRRAVVQPALKCGYRFENEQLVDEILAEVEGERGALPMLAFAVSRLWDKRDREGGVLTRSAYEQVGGVAGALAQHAEATVDQIGPERLPLVREMFRNLVTAQGTRAARDVDDLLSIFGDQHDAAEDVLRHLIDARLLTSFEYTTLEEDEEKKRRRVEIIHESLITNWPRLVRWRTQDADSAQMRDQLRQVASMWEDRGHPEDLLWTGTSFKEYEVWRERYPGALTATEESFAKSMTKRTMRRRRQKRIAVGVAFVVMLGIMAVFASLWRQARAEARRAEAGRLHALASAELEDHPTAALAYATASLELADNPAVRELVVRTLWKGPTAFAEETTVTDFITLRFSGAGEWLAGGGHKGTVRVWRRDGSPSFLLEGHAEDVTASVAFLPNDRFLISSAMESDEDGVLAWSLPDGQLRHKFDLPGGFSRRLGDRMIHAEEIGERKFVIRSLELTEGDTEELGTVALREGVTWWDVDFEGGFLGYCANGDVFMLPLDKLESAAPRRIIDADEDIAFFFYAVDGQILTFYRTGNHFDLWLPGSHSPVQTFRSGSPGDLGLVGLVGDGKLFRAWSQNPNITTVWSLSADYELPLRVLRGPGLPTNDAWVTDSRGSWLAANNADEKTTYVWDLTAPPGAEPMILSRGKAAHGTMGISIHPEGTWLAVGDTHSVSLRPLKRRYPHVLARDNKTTFVDVTFDPEGRWMASSSTDGKVRWWPLKPENGEPNRVLHDLKGWLNLGQLKAGPYGDRIAATNQRSGEFEILDLSGEVNRTLSGFEAARLGDWGGPVFDREGRRLAGSKGNVIRIWNLETGEELVLESEGGQVGPVSFITDDQLLTDGEAGLRLWNIAQGSSEVLIDEWIRGEISPDRRFVLAVLVEPDTAPLSGPLVVYDIEEGVSRRIETHGDAVTTAVWHPSGDRIGTVDPEGVIRIGPATGEEPHLLIGHVGMVYALEFHPEGGWIASAGSDGTVRLWPVPEGRPLHTLPREELIERLRSLTNYRVVADAESGYRIEFDRLPSWEEVPTW